MIIFKKIFIFILVVTVLTLSVFVGGKVAIRMLYPTTYSELVEKYCEEYGVEKSLMFAIIKTESNFRADAVSDAGARGLTQILPETFEWLRSKTGEKLSSDMLFDSEVSIRYGTYMISILLKEFDNNRETAIAAYHAGIGIVGRWLEDEKYSYDGKNLKEIPYNDTKLYVENVKTAIAIYENIYDM